MGKPDFDYVRRLVEALPARELDELAELIAEIQARHWDRQIEEDVKAGRLDKFIADAKAEIAAGKTRPL